MTNTPTDEREGVDGDGDGDDAADATPVPAAPAAEVAVPSEAGPEPEPIPFWQRPYVERFLVPLVLPIAVIVGLVAYILNISRLFLSGHGHIPIFVGSAITVMILLGATLLSAASPRLRQSAITLVSAAFILSIMSGGWLVLGHSQPEKTGPTTLPATLKTTQTLSVTAAIGGNLKFTPDQLTAKTGLAKINVTVAGAGHTFNMRDATTLFASLSLDAAGTVKSGVAFFPTPGSYGFFCAIPGHDALGMHGTITVTGLPTTLTQALTAAGNAATAAG
jgi:plastocyanin